VRNNDDVLMMMMFWFLLQLMFTDTYSITVKHGIVLSSSSSSSSSSFILNQAAWPINIKHKGQRTDRNTQNIHYLYYTVYYTLRSENNIHYCFLA